MAIKEHSNKNGLSDFIEITDNQVSKKYFNKLLKVSEALSKICQGQMNQDNHSIDDITVLKYIEKLNNSLQCMRMKYWFNGSEFTNQSSILLVDSVDSGFPSKKEFHELSKDASIANTALENLEPIENLKKKQLDYLISHKKINREIQFDMQAHEYYNLLKSKELFLADNEPVIYPVNKSDNGNARYLIHWATFDIEKNIPVVFILLVEYSGKGKLEEDEMYSDFYSELKHYSSTGFKLLTIATELDKKYSKIHPKSLKRINVGPLYINGFTKHNKNVKNALEYVQEHHEEDNWLFGYTVESLYSKSTTKIDAGLFKADQIKEIYYVDPHNPESVESGCSDIEKSMVIPYVAYQHLSEQENNSLNDIQKYVVRNENEIVYL